MYAKGTLVEHGGRHYVADGELNMSKPGDYLNNLLYSFFVEPSRTMLILNIVHGITILLQIVLSFLQPQFLV